MTEWMTPVASVGILNVQTATCGNGCVSCCGYTSFRVLPNPLYLPVGGTASMKAEAKYCTGVWHDYTSQSTWNSVDPPIASVSAGGLATGEAPGSTWIRAKFPLLEQRGTFCEVSFCPRTNPEPVSPTTVYNFTVNISPSAIRPKDTGGTTTTTVTVQTTYPYQSQPVTLQDVRIVGAAYGGHEPNHPTTFPTGTGGTFSAASGNTNSADGKFTSTYTARTFAGEHQIKATMGGVTKTGPITLRAKVEGLAQLIDGDFFNLIGDTANHRLPNNHYGTSTANTNLQAIATQYAGQYGGSILLYNDQSLPWGGLFDIGPTPSCPTCVFWLPDHNEHRLGVNCDVDDTAVPQERWTFLENLFRTNGFPNFAPEHNKHHWHLRP